MAKAARTAKLPSIKQEFADDIKSWVHKELSNELKDGIQQFDKELSYVERRVSALENESFKRETSKLSLTEWCMIACYAAIFVSAVIVTIRAIKKTSQYGHS